VSAPIGYYVHHHGAGHGAHAVALARVLGPRLVGLGSGAPPPGWSGTWVELPRDDDPAPTNDPTRGGAWHWAPRRHRGFTARMRSIAGWVAACEPAAMVVDVSAEVVALAALLGVPTAAVVLHGERTDGPHRAAFATADALVAPWPAEHAEDHHRPWADLRHIGLLSRHDGRAVAPPVGDGRVLLVLPGGDHGLTVAGVEAAARATGRRWDVVGRPAGPPPPGDASEGSPVRWHGHVDDPWPLLCDASVVVSAAGAASVAEVAAARRPAVLVPQPRPFDEQASLARQVARWAPVMIPDGGPGEAAWSADWPEAVERAAALDGEGWGRHHDGRAADRFAAVLAEIEVP
jgi:hypothetical protein